MMQRRHLLQSTAVMPLLGLGACASTSMGSSAAAKAKVVVIGGGYGGASVAKYVRLLSNYKVNVVLVEPNDAFVSCPLSNLVVSGSRQLAEITSSYAGLSKKHGVTMVRDMALGIDTVRREVRLARGSTISYDKLVVSPGVDLMFDSIEGYAAGHAAGQLRHAWKAGEETVALHRQIAAMPDGGVFAITIPVAPYRCPPGPYERACQVAWYLQRKKPRSKVLILDGNPDVTSKGPLFKKVWAGQYKGLIEYRGDHKVVAVDAKSGTLRFEVQENVKADVINALPSMRAGRVAVEAGLANMANGNWCGVHYQTFESTAARDVHVIGDSIQVAPAMPKSGHMANAHAKVTAAAVVAQLFGLEVNATPMLTNTCYSFVDDKNVIHVASVHAYSAAEKTFKTVAGSGGVSVMPSELEGIYAMNWAKNIWADVLD